MTDRPSAGHLDRFRRRIMTPETGKAFSDPLWILLSAFVFEDPAAERPFTDRLAEENGWTTEFTRRAIEEYRRFIYLAVTCNHLVVPPEAVDQVWHLHLLYTRSYWDELCRGILGRLLHHDPSPGGSGTRARESYKDTLKSYQIVFGVPPEDIWQAMQESCGSGPVCKGSHPNCGETWSCTRG
jgi:hypothetical protein